MPSGPHGDETPEKEELAVDTETRGLGNDQFIRFIGSWKTIPEEISLGDPQEGYLKKLWLDSFEFNYDLNPDKCECGTDKTYGPTATAKMHSAWCPKHGG